MFFSSVSKAKTNIAAYYSEHVVVMSLNQKGNGDDCNGENGDVYVIGVVLVLVMMMMIVLVMVIAFIISFVIPLGITLQFCYRCL